MENIKSQETFETNIYILISFVFYMICCVIPFNVTDFYYSYSYSYSLCLDESIIPYLNIRLLLKINGYVYVIFMLYIMLILARCINFFENTFLMRTSIFLKLSYNLIWGILLCINYFKLYNSCESDIKIYLMIRLFLLCIFLILSLRKIKMALL